MGACDLLNTVQYDIRKSDTKKLNTAGFMTEFGANPNTTDGWAYVDRALDKMDEFQHSWSYWYFTANGNRYVMDI